MFTLKPPAPTPEQGRTSVLRHLGFPASPTSGRVFVHQSDARHWVFEHASERNFRPNWRISLQ